MQSSRFNIGTMAVRALGSPAVALPLISILVTAVFLGYLKPPILSDQLDYFSSAARLPDITASHRHLRVGIIWPAWAAIQAFGYSELAYYLVPFLAAVFLGFGTWWLGRLMFSPAVGWISSILVVLIPRYVWDMPHVLPDYFAAGLFTIAVALVFWDSSNRGKVGTWRSLLALVTAGALVGWAYLAREYIAILFPCMGLAMLLLKTPWRGWMAFCAGAISAYLLELLWGWFVYQDPFIRISAAGAPRETSRPFATDVVQIVSQLPAVFSDLPGGVLVAAFVVFGLVAGLAGLAVRHPGWRVIAAWSVLGWSFFTLIALLPVWLFDGDAVYLRMHKFRYWALIFPPIFIGGVAAVAAISRALARRNRAIAFVLAAMLLAVPSYGYFMGLRHIGGSGALVRVKSSDYVEFREFLRRERTNLPDVFWTDRASGVSGEKALPMYFRSWSGLDVIWPGELRYLNESRSEWRDRSSIQEGYVILDRTRANVVVSSRRPDYFAVPEAVWSTVFRSSNGNVLVLDPTSGPALVDHAFTLVPAILQVLPAPGSSSNYNAVTSNGRLEVSVGRGARVVVTGSAGAGLGAPDPDDSPLVARRDQVVSGYVDAKTKGDPEEALRVRCMFYDEDGKRVAPWAEVAPVRSGDEETIRHLFRCPSPQFEFPEATFRVMLELREGADISIEEISYGAAVPK